ncbi:pentapeptide repeat-containing protein [uncultured Pseudoteredinibacter sp.]|uniref:pentapeptide repeat-containing protein n=1 Tax=uncultured Pseudoteredinibacter sp. TaxID=1641701 RepID=UPI0026284949|nr:pentapeptide repeat-containing protein [uncultured Pseudoteredinibacter sp.]
MKKWLGLTLTLLAIENSIAATCNWDSTRSNWDNCEFFSEYISLNPSLSYSFNNVTVQGGTLEGDFSEVDLSTVRFRRAGDNLGDEVDIGQADFSPFQWIKVENNGLNIFYLLSGMVDDPDQRRHEASGNLLFAGEPDILPASQAGIGDLGVYIVGQFELKDEYPMGAAPVTENPLSSSSGSAEAAISGSGFRSNAGEAHFWQLDFKNSYEISRLELLPNAGQEQELAGATVLLSDYPFSVDPSVAKDFDYIARFTLPALETGQSSYHIPVERTARFVRVIKQDGERLGFHKIRVMGEVGIKTPDTPLPANAVRPSCGGFSIALVDKAKRCDVTRLPDSGSSNVNIDFSFCNFSGRDLSGLNFSGAQLSNADFSQADLSGASFDSSQAENANFSGTNLSNVDFSRANLREADMRGAIWSATFFDQTEPENACIDRSVWESRAGTTGEDGRLVGDTSDISSGVSSPPQLVDERFNNSFQYARQPSVDNNGAAVNAIDGNAATQSQTRADQSKPWWVLDLGATFFINDVELDLGSQCTAAVCSDLQLLISDWDPMSYPVRDLPAENQNDELFTWQAVNRDDKYSFNRTGRYIVVQAANDVTGALAIAGLKVNSSSEPVFPSTRQPISPTISSNFGSAVRLGTELEKLSSNLESLDSDLGQLRVHASQAYDATLKVKRLHDRLKRIKRDLGRADTMLKAASFLGPIKAQSARIRQIISTVKPGVDTVESFVGRVENDGVKPLREKIAKLRSKAEQGQRASDNLYQYVDKGYGLYSDAFFCAANTEGNKGMDALEIIATGNGSAGTTVDSFVYTESGIVGGVTQYQVSSTPVTFNIDAPLGFNPILNTASKMVTGQNDRYDRSSVASGVDLSSFPSGRQALEDRIKNFAADQNVGLDTIVYSTDQSVLLVRDAFTAPTDLADLMAVLDQIEEQLKRLEDAFYAFFDPLSQLIALFEIRIDAGFTSFSVLSILEGLSNIPGLDKLEELANKIIEAILSQLKSLLPDVSLPGFNISLPTIPDFPDLFNFDFLAFPSLNLVKFDLLVAEPFPFCFDRPEIPSYPEFYADLDGDKLINGQEAEACTPPSSTLPYRAGDRQDPNPGCDSHPFFGSNADTVDSDGDGFDDYFEATYHQAFTGLDLNPIDSNMPNAAALAGDSDGDGLTLAEEYAAGTNPTETDTDGDGLSDQYELEYQNLPDRLNTFVQAKLQLGNFNDFLNPVSGEAISTAGLHYEAAADYDNDGLNNLAEAQNGANPYHHDSDDDGMDDVFELASASQASCVSLSYRLRLNDASDANADPDGDKLSNQLESELGSDICNPDSDGDGINDGFEHKSNTSLISAAERPVDSDGNGVPDDIENLVDSDGDGFSDGDEKANGTDPDDAASKPANDVDGDNISDLSDTDNDNDGYSDQDEQDNGTNPRDSGDTPVDFDGDKISDRNDDDDDNDGYSDADEEANKTNSKDAADKPADLDGDFVSDLLDADADGNGNNEPRIENLRISGSPEVGGELIASFDYVDDEGDAEQGTEVRWFRVVNGMKEFITASPLKKSSSLKVHTKHAMSVPKTTSYRPTKQDQGRPLGVQITPRDGAANTVAGKVASFQLALSSGANGIPTMPVGLLFVMGLLISVFARRKLSVQ